MPRKPILQYRRVPEMSSDMAHFEELLRGDCVTDKRVFVPHCTRESILEERLLRVHSEGMRGRADEKVDLAFFKFLLIGFIQTHEFECNPGSHLSNFLQGLGHQNGRSIFGNRQAKLPDGCGGIELRLGSHGALNLEQTIAHWLHEAFR